MDLFPASKGYGVPNLSRGTRKTATKSQELPWWRSVPRRNSLFFASDLLDVGIRSQMPKKAVTCDREWVAGDRRIEGTPS